MITTILTSVATFISTGIDEIVVLTILFTFFKKGNSVRDIYIGQQISMGVLLAVSLLAVFGIASIPREWIGLLGLIPLIQGLRILIDRNYEDDDYDKEDIIKKSKKFNSLILSVAFIAIAGGAEELTIYIPYFASLDTRNLIMALIIFNVLVPIWCAICQKISSLQHIQKVVEKYEKVIVPIVFIGLGIFVLIENNTISMLLGLTK